MTPGEDVLVQAARMSAEGQPFVLATVLSVRRPASTRRGDRGLVTADGRLCGWVGGACSEPIVVREALRALADGQPRVVRIAPPGDTAAPPDTDVILAESHCASEGVVEVLIEPRLPSPQLAIIGESPAARTLAQLAGVIGWRVSEELTPAAEAVVVATMGRLDEDVVRAALKGDAPYIGLVASARRARKVLAALRDQGVAEEQLTRVRSPAGLDLGPGSQEEIAVAILAELVACLHERARAVPSPGLEAADPVCGMTLAAAGAESALHGGRRYWFCGPGCRARFAADPDRYAAPAPPAAAV